MYNSLKIGSCDIVGMMVTIFKMEKDILAIEHCYGRAVGK